MDAPTPDDELLLILLRNLRNAGATFGEGTPPYEAIRTTIEDHLHEMQRKGISTNLTRAREAVQARKSQAQQSAATPADSQQQAASEIAQLTNTFANLAFRPKPGASG